MNYNILRSEIVKNGYTQAEVAEQIGMSPNSLSRKLTGKREFTMGEARKLSRVLNIANPGDVFFGELVPNEQRNADIT